MLLNSDQIRGIIEGVTEGYKSVGKELNDNERVIVKMTVMTTIETLERMMDLVNEG